MILAILIMWGLSGILTWRGVFPDNLEDLHYGARTDAKIDAITESTWIRVPYLCTQVFKY